MRGRGEERRGEERRVEKKRVGESGGEERRREEKRGGESGGEERRREERSRELGHMATCTYPHQQYPNTSITQEWPVRTCRFSAPSHSLTHHTHTHITQTHTHTAAAAAAALPQDIQPDWL